MASGWGGNFMPNAAQTQAGNSMVVFINDDSSVANYPVQMGFTVALINANDPKNSRMYIKAVESNGMPIPTRVFKIEEITPRQDGDVISRKEFDEMNSQLNAQYADLNQKFSMLMQALEGQNSEGKGKK